MSLVSWEFDGELYCAQSTEVRDCAGQTTYYELSEARLVPGDSASASASPASGPAAVTAIVYEPEEEKPPMVFFDADQTLPFAVLQHFVTFVAAELRAGQK